MSNQIDCSDDFNDLTTELISPLDKQLCSGIGQKHTDRFGGDLLNISLAQIRDMVNTPQNIDKASAQWFIPSDIITRKKETHLEIGSYYALWADLDDNPPNIQDLADLVMGFIGDGLDCDFEIYTSKSAKEDYQKSRIIIPLASKVNADDFEMLQECLNDWLESNEITPDRSSQSANQLCYLPNKGDYYDSLNSRESLFLNAKEFFSKELIAKKSAIKQVQIESQERKAVAEIKRKERTANGFESPIDEFNDLYPIEGILESMGYSQKGNRFLHPNSQSGGYSAYVKDGRVHTFSSSDPLYLKKGAHDAFSVFTVLKHKGERTAALIDAGNNYLNIGDESWNKVKQRQFMENNSATDVKDDFDVMNDDLSPEQIKAVLRNIPKALYKDNESILKIACGLKAQLLSQGKTLEKLNDKDSGGYKLLEVLSKNSSQGYNEGVLFNTWCSLDVNGGYTFQQLINLSGGLGKEKEKPKSFADFALNKMVDSMKQQMLDDVYILGEFAILGQITNLYAGPNTGKTAITIKLLIDAVKQGDIEGGDVFYINADDTYRGLVTKTELVNEYGINMLAPGHNDFERSHVEEILKRMTQKSTAKGKIIIVDTLKKFSDLMDKKASSNFMELLRQFVSKGGSVILLAHINKKRDDEGKPIFQGTTDSVDDADCCYTIDCVQSITEKDYGGIETTSKSIMFENFKARGDVTQKHTYSYEVIKGQPYNSIINSFKSVDDTLGLQMQEAQRIKELIAANSDHIECVLDGIKAGITQKTELLERLVENQAISKAAARKVLDIHEGDERSKGHYWKCTKGGEKNVKFYSELPIFGSSQV